MLADDDWNDDVHTGAVEEEDFLSEMVEDEEADWSGMEEVKDSDDDAALPAASSSSRAARSSPSSSSSVLREETCPRQLQERIQRDVQEVRLLSPFTSSDVNMGGGTRIVLRVGLPVSTLGMNAEQVRAWGLSNRQLLMVELHFPAHYFSVATGLIKVSVGQCASTAAPSEQTPLTKCKLSWPLESRIRKQFLPSLPAEMREAGFSVSKAASVSEICDVTALTAIRALLDCNDDENAAVLRIEQQQQAAAAEEEREAELQQREAEPEEEQQVDEARPALKKKKKARRRWSFWSAKRRKRKSLAAKKKQEEEAVVPDVSPDPAPGAPELNAKEAGTEVEPEEQAAQTPQDDEHRAAEGGAAASSSSLSLSGSGEADELFSLLSGHNFLVRLLRFLREKLRSVHSTCIICERQLPFPGLNLSVCSSELCKMSFETMGVGFDVAAAIAAEPALTDLYISMLSIAAAANHLPFAQPLTVSAKGKDGMETNFQLGDGAVDWRRLNTVIALIPSVDSMLRLIAAGAAGWAESMNALDPLIVPLLRWLFISNPTYLRELSKAERFASINTEHQYVLLMSSPEKEHRFQELKKQAAQSNMGGSVWAFHGGPSKNWHSILRTGLKNLSGTSLQANGAVYGHGIYLAADSATSLSYSNYPSSSGIQNWECSRLGLAPRFLALVEVVAGSGSFKPYLVVPDEQRVSTRYLFVFNNNAMNAASATAADLRQEMQDDLLNFDVQAVHAATAQQLTPKQSTAAK